MSSHSPQFRWSDTWLFLAIGLAACYSKAMQAAIDFFPGHSPTDARDPGRPIVVLPAEYEAAVAQYTRHPART